LLNYLVRLSAVSGAFIAVNFLDLSRRKGEASLTVEVKDLRVPVWSPPSTRTLSW